MSWKTTFTTYAQLSDPARLPLNVRVSHTERALSLFDKFPKAMYHLLVLPRVHESLTLKDLASLETVLNMDEGKAKGCLLMLKEESALAISMIEDEMVKTHGFKWKIWTGFHSVPSMDHLHLHVISSDLCSESLKNKKHYNSFHPSLGFFLHLDDVLSWFDLAEDEFRERASLQPRKYEILLKRDLRSWRTKEMFRTIPLLKSALQEEWEREKRQQLRSANALTQATQSLDTRSECPADKCVADVNTGNT